MINVLGCDCGLGLLQRERMAWMIEGLGIFGVRSELIG